MDDVSLDLGQSVDRPGLVVEYHHQFVVADGVHLLDTRAQRRACAGVHAVLQADRANTEPKAHAVRFYVLTQLGQSRDSRFVPGSPPAIAYRRVGLGRVVIESIAQPPQRLDNRQTVFIRPHHAV